MKARRSGATGRWVVALSLAIATARPLIAQSSLSLGQAATRQDLNSVYFLDSLQGWIGGDGGFLARTTDRGKTWSPIPLAASDAVNDICFGPNGNGLLLAGNAIYGVREGELRWSEVRRFLPSELNEAEAELYSACFSSGKTAWVVGAISRNDRVIDSLLACTDDAGLSWSRQPVPSRTELIHLRFADKLHGWIVGAEGVILSTSDGGRNWARQSSGTDATLHHVDFIDSMRGWIVGARGTILRTTDGGKHWEPVSNGPKATLLSVRFTDNRNGWCVGRGGTIMHSGDGGRSWTPHESGTKQHLLALSLHQSYVWVVGGGGIILHCKSNPSP